MALFLDELAIDARAGRGGDGLVHFARRKYQPFGGPDGGDGGKGGDVVLSGKRDADSLYHLRTAATRAGAGQNGGPNLMIGSNAADCELAVPLGTLAYDAASGYELGSVCATGARLIVAKGGQGGKGNPHYSTGRRRAPKMAQPGAEGEQREVLLRYRIYAGSALIEPGEPLPGCLLPHLLGRPASEIDYALYWRKPRWIRTEHEFNRYDAAYLPCLSDAAAEGWCPFIAHVYWAESLFVNLRPLGNDAAPHAAALLAALHDLPLRRLKRLTVCALKPLFEPLRLDSDAGEVDAQCIAAASVDDIAALYKAQLSGGTVE